MTRTHFSIGSITESRFYLSVERPSVYAHWAWRWGKTYNGTRWGLLVITPAFILMCHQRALSGPSSARAPEIDVPVGRP